MVLPVSLNNRFLGRAYHKGPPEQKQVYCRNGSVLKAQDVTFEVKSVQVGDPDGIRLAIRSVYPVVIYRHFIPGSFDSSSGDNKFEVRTGEFDDFYDAISDLRENEKIEVLDYLTYENVATVYLKRTNLVYLAFGLPYVLVGDFG